jgi:hypothetical protein
VDRADRRVRRRPHRARQQPGRAGATVGRKNNLFAGSDRSAERAAAFYTLIESAKLNGLDSLAYLRDVLTRIADHPARRLADLLPWNWTPVAQAARSSGPPPTAYF